MRAVSGRDLTSRSLLDFLKILCYNIYVKKNKEREKKNMLKLTIEELSALNMILQFTKVEDLLNAAMHGYAESEESRNKELSDLCWKVLKSLR